MRRRAPGEHMSSLNGRTRRERKIRVRGAREHNLKDLNLDMPRDKLIVITGLSGSGKSSLAFDTLYGEGQRRYIESLSAYARQFIDQIGKPDVDSIEGLSPTIAIEQKTVSKNPRSTVGTVTEIYDHLRLLYARLGLPHCPSCGQSMNALNVEQMVSRAMGLGSGKELEILAPIVRGRKGIYRKEFEDLERKGLPESAGGRAVFPARRGDIAQPPYDAQHRGGGGSRRPAPRRGKSSRRIHRDGFEPREGAGDFPGRRRHRVPSSARSALAQSAA